MWSGYRRGRTLDSCLQQALSSGIERQTCGASTSPRSRFKSSNVHHPHDRQSRPEIASHEVYLSSVRNRRHCDRRSTALFQRDAPSHPARRCPNPDVPLNSRPPSLTNSAHGHSSKGANFRVTALPERLLPTKNLPRFPRLPSHPDSSKLRRRGRQYRRDPVIFGAGWLGDGRATSVCVYASLFGDFVHSDNAQ